MAHVAPWKKKVVEELTNEIKNKRAIGVVRLDNLPALQFNRMRAKLRGIATIKVAKKRLIKLALEKSGKENIQELEKYFDGMIGLILTDENPFRLAKILEKNKSPAPAKAGQIAPRDIVVKAGPTPFAPGPIISELSSIGLVAGVDKGKVAIKQDKVVVKEGEVISEKVASVLTRLGIEPMEIGLDLRAVYEDGVVFDSKTLYVDETKYREDIINAVRDSIALSIGIAYPTEETIKTLIMNAHRDARNLALSQEIFADALAKDLIVLAQRKSEVLKALLEG
ncbi:MAG: large subunit ribosomal protein [Candidatus Woesearchaeota archaeon]|nr:large subunit ribosomal protein [Candidatus Woesearchaeota archaeon]MDN5327455.1 large subunit ribosomal protein [Candidatus Woesearchaeota archaeon]